MKAIFRNMQGKASAAFGVLMLAAVAVVLGAALVAPQGIKSAYADTQNYGPGTPVYTIPIQLSGTYSASTSSVAAIKMPYAARLIGFSGIMRDYSGTGATHNIDLRAGATSVLSAPVTLSTASVTEATIATAAIADETTLFVDFALGASGVNATDMTLLLTVVR